MTVTDAEVGFGDAAATVCQQRGDVPGLQTDEIARHHQRHVAGTGAQRAFSDLEALVAFLRAEIGQSDDQSPLILPTVARNTH